MLNLEETIAMSFYYNREKDLYIKGIFYIFASVLFLQLLRSQLCEISLLQLVPGSFLLLIGISFVLLMVTSTYGFSIPFWIDNKSGLGIKTVNRLGFQTQLSGSGLLLIVFFLFSLNTIIPIGLDSFDSYDQETLTNLWSFDQVLNLETLLVTVLVTLSQLPTSFGYCINTESDIFFLVKSAKDFSFLSFVIGGVVSPTVDIYTQINLALAAIVLYFVVIFVTKKNVFIKSNNTTCLHF